MNDNTFLIHPPKPSRPAEKALLADPISLIGKNDISWESCNAAYREAIKAEKESARAGQLKRQRQKAESIRKHIALPCNLETGLKPGLPLWELLGAKAKPPPSTPSSTPSSRASSAVGPLSRPRSAALPRSGSSRGAQREADLILCIPDTILLGLEGGPVWLYTRVDGTVCRSVDFPADDVIAQMGNLEAEDALVALCKKLREDGSCETTLLNTLGLRALMHPRNVHGFTVIQSYIKPRGKRAAVCRCCFKGLAARGLTPWLMTSKYDFSCQDRQDMSEVLLLPTSSPNSCASVEQLSGPDATQLGFTTLSLLSHVEARLGCKLGDLAADFIQDDDTGNWWFVGIKYFSVRQQPPPVRATSVLQTPSVSSLVPPAVALFRSASARSGSRRGSANEGEEDSERLTAKPLQGDPVRLRRCRSCQQQRPEPQVAWEMTMRTVLECMEHLKRRGVAFEWFDHHSFSMVSDDNSTLSDPAVPDASSKPISRADASSKQSLNAISENQGQSATSKPLVTAAAIKPIRTGASSARGSATIIPARATLAAAADAAKRPLPLSRKAMLLASKIQICTSCYKLYNEELKLIDLETRFAWELGLQASAAAAAAAGGVDGTAGSASALAASNTSGAAANSTAGQGRASDGASASRGIGPDASGQRMRRRSGSGGSVSALGDAVAAADTDEGGQVTAGASPTDSSPESAQRLPSWPRPDKLIMFRLLVFFWGVEDLKIAPLPDKAPTKKWAPRTPLREELPPLELSYQLLGATVRLPLQPSTGDHETEDRGLSQTGGPYRLEESEGGTRLRHFVAKKLRLFHVLAVDVDSVAAWMHEGLQGRLPVTLRQLSEGGPPARIGTAHLPWAILLPPEPTTTAHEAYGIKDTPAARAQGAAARERARGGNLPWIDAQTRHGSPSGEGPSGSRGGELDFGVPSASPSDERRPQGRVSPSGERALPSAVASGEGGEAGVSHEASGGALQESGWEPSEGGDQVSLREASEDAGQGRARLDGDEAEPMETQQERHLLVFDGRPEEPQEASHRGQTGLLSGEESGAEDSQPGMAEMEGVRPVARPARPGRGGAHHPWQPPVRQDVMQPLQGAKCKGAFLKASIGLQVGPKFSWECIPGANRLQQLHRSGVWQAPPAASLSAFPLPQEWVLMLEMEVPSSTTPSSWSGISSAAKPLSSGAQPDNHPENSGGDPWGSHGAAPTLDQQDLDRISSFQQFSRLVRGDIGVSGARPLNPGSDHSRRMNENLGEGRGVETAHPAWAHAHRSPDGHGDAFSDEGPSGRSAADASSTGGEGQGADVSGQVVGEGGRDDGGHPGNGHDRWGKEGEDGSISVRRSSREDDRGGMGQIEGDGDGDEDLSDENTSWEATAGASSQGGLGGGGTGGNGRGTSSPGANGLVLLGEGADPEGWSPAAECHDSSVVVLWRLAVQLSRADNIPPSAGETKVEFDLLGQSFSSSSASSTEHRPSAMFNETWVVHFRGTRSALDAWLMRNMVLTLRASCQACSGVFGFATLLLDGLPASTQPVPFAADINVVSDDGGVFTPLGAPRLAGAIQLVQCSSGKPMEVSWTLSHQDGGFDVLHSS